jgi:hypothetical protein
MKTLLYTALISGALACGATLGQAADLQAVVPFDFRVGDAVLLAGNYQIHEMRDLVQLRNGQGTGNAFRLTLPASRSRTSLTGKLVFKQYNGEYHLTTIWAPDSQQGRLLIPSKREKELEAKSKAVQMAQVPMVLSSR